MYDAFVKEAGIPAGSFFFSPNFPLPFLPRVAHRSHCFTYPETSVDKSYLLERSQIVESVLAGEIRQAVSKLSDVDSTLLRGIGFHLQKQALLEIIRKGNASSEALKYAQVQVAPLAKDRPEFILELENVMSLLLYSNLSQSPDFDLLSDAQRQRTADIANSALLRYTQLSEKPKLERIMKSIFWAQDVAQRYGIHTPKLTDLRNLIFETKAANAQEEAQDEEDASIILRMDVTAEDDPEEEEDEGVEAEGDDEEEEEGLEEEADEEEEPFLVVAYTSADAEPHIPTEEDEE